MPTIPGTIAATISDEELSRLVALYVLGWKERDSSFEECQWEMPDGDRCPLPSFATDANAVLPLIAKTNEGWGCDCDTRGGKLSYHVTICDSYYDANSAVADTFPRAACFALLKAKGWKVSDVSP